jgi:hypothetical protein
MGLATGLAVAGGLVSAAGSVMAGQAQASAAEAQAKVASQNARLAELQGVEELHKGARDEHKMRQQAEQFQASQRSALAASGGTVGGSALSLLADTSQGVEEDATTLRYNTLQNKYERDVEAVNFRNQASAARAQAHNAKTAGWMGGFTTLLSTTGQVLGMNPIQPTGSSSKGGMIAVGANGDYYRDKNARWNYQRMY